MKQCAGMRRHQPLLAYRLLSEWYPGRFEVETPYPPAGLSDDELETLKSYLNGCMPVGSMIGDLWDGDIHFEDSLGDDWYFEAVFGPPSSEESCAGELAEFFLEKVDEWHLDYGLESDPTSFLALVREDAGRFIAAWRDNVINERILDDRNRRGGTMDQHMKNPQEFPEWRGHLDWMLSNRPERTRGLFAANKLLAYLDRTTARAMQMKLDLMKQNLPQVEVDEQVYAAIVAPAEGLDKVQVPLPEKLERQIRQWSHNLPTRTVVITL